VAGADGFTIGSAPGVPGGRLALGELEGPVPVGPPLRSQEQGRAGIGGIVKTPEQALPANDSAGAMPTSYGEDLDRQVFKPQYEEARA
jgi:hypothetical protein